MKNGKKLTLKQRKHLEYIGLNVNDWLLAKKQSDIWTLQHRITGQAKEVFAPVN